MQVYNLGIDDHSKQNGAMIEYQIKNLALPDDKAVIFTYSEATNKLSPNADQVTLEKTLPLASLQPGNYMVSIKINDGVKKQQTDASAPFIID